MSGLGILPEDQVVCLIRTFSLTIYFICLIKDHNRIQNTQYKGQIYPNFQPHGKGYIKICACRCCCCRCCHRHRRQQQQFYGIFDYVKCFTYSVLSILQHSFKYYYSHYVHNSNQIPA